MYTIIVTITAPTIITRSEWGAKPPKGTVAPLSVNPPPYVIIHHAASDTCTTRAICQARVRSFQVCIYLIILKFCCYIMLLLLAITAAVLLCRIITWIRKNGATLVTTSSWVRMEMFTKVEAGEKPAPTPKLTTRRALASVSLAITKVSSSCRRTEYYSGFYI